MADLFHRDGWGVVDELAEAYGGVSKIHGMFGVRHHLDVIGVVS